MNGDDRTTDMVNNSNEAADGNGLEVAAATGNGDAEAGHMKDRHSRLIVLETGGVCVHTLQVRINVRQHIFTDFAPFARSRRRSAGGATA